jgi:hypothetical protein
VIYISYFQWLINWHVVRLFLPIGTILKVNTYNRILLCVEWYFLVHRTKNGSIFTTAQRMDFVECNHPYVNPVNGERQSS